MHRLVAVLTLFIILSGCTAFVNTVTDEPIRPDPTGKSIGTDFGDSKMETFIGVNIIKADPALANAHVNVTVYNGLVLITGEAPSAEMKALAGDTARDYHGQRKVYNELQLRGKTSVVSRTNDSIISGKIKTKLAFTKGIDFSDMKVVTEDSVVYLLGTLYEDMGDIAAEVARNTRGVRKVVKCFEYVEKPKLTEPTEFED
jgi:osmotically-inducible protein OsmY